MKTMIMAISLLVVVSTSAHAVYRDNSYMNNMYSPSYNDIPTVRLIW